MSDAIAAFPIRAVDVSSEEFESAVAVLNQGMREEWGDLAASYSLEDYRAEATAPGADVRYYMVWIGKDPAGVAKLDLLDPAGTEAFAVVRVLQAVQGYGIARRLIEHIEEVARQHGRTRLVGTTAARSYRDDRNTRILERAGYFPFAADQRQDLAAPFDTARLAAAPVPDGYRIECHDRVPEAWLADIAALSTEFDDAVLPVAHQPWTPERIRDDEDRYRRANRLGVIAIAVEEASGRPVGFSMAEYRLGDPLADMLGSYVRPPHRGHGLGTALRAHALLALLERFPDLPRVRSFTSTDDTTTIRIFRSLGFTDTGFFRDWEKALAAE